MVGLNLLGTLLGARFGTPMTQGSLSVDQMQANGARLTVVNATTGETVRLTLALGKMASLVDFATQTAPRLVAPLTGAAIPTSFLPETLSMALAEPARCLTAWAAPGAGVAGAEARLLASTLAGQTYLYAARPLGDGIDVFRASANGAGVTAVGYVADTATTHATTLRGMAMASLTGGTYLYTASGGEAGLTYWRIDANGMPVAMGNLDAASGLPVQSPSDLRSFQAFGTTWLCLAAQGSSSLTVMRLGPDGTPFATDHVVDDLDTRFQGAAVVETATIGNQAYVMATGADRGISLFALTPTGRLVHLTSLADSDAACLGAISAMRAVPMGGVLQIVVTSAAEAGLSVLSVDLSAVQVIGAAANGGAGGGAGDDILLDARGSETLTGGAGADTFVLAADGLRDVVADFDPTQDRLDLQDWAFLRSMAQVAVTPTATGAVLTYGGEELVLNTVTGTPLSVAQVRAMSIGAGSHVPILPMAEGAAAPTVVVTPPVVIPPVITPPVVAPPVVAPPAPPPFGGHDVLLGTPGPDTLDGQAGNDTISGLSGSDSLIGGIGSDCVYGGAGNDGLFGGDGADCLDGGDGHDRLDGGLGNDSLTGGAGNDTLSGGGDSDSLNGGAGLDSLDGGLGDDLIYGGADNDRLFGAAGADRLFGGAGNDTVEGGAGNDILTGGMGADVFVFAAFAANSFDRITDFQDGIDRVSLPRISGTGGAKLAALNIHAAAHDTVWGSEITVAGHAIFLDHVTPSQLSLNDFLFG